MKIRIKKRSDGSAALSCERANGSRTWQRQEGAQGRFFPLHDLTHFAVETELGLRRAFFGLVAEGWDIADFGSPWPRGPLPYEALYAEWVVGFLDAERAAGEHWDAAELAVWVGRHADAAKASLAPQESARPALSEAELESLRARRQELFVRWRALADGDTLELELPD